ncbi:MAG: universal stress protein, partial [Saprospiraceae bacterium]|nr:universal stress protein [Saprospiraceae bacterium]
MRIIEKEKGMQLELLGIGSQNYRQFYINLERALSEMSMHEEIVEVQTVSKFLQYNLSGIPALRINGKVIFEKILPTVEELKIALTLAREAGVKNLGIKKILVPTDFSKNAENALRYAIELAAPEGAEISMVHVHQSGEAPKAGIQ